MTSDPESVQGVARENEGSTDSDAHNWGWRFTTTLLFPDT
jgi:hypothetical protein